MNFQMNRRIQHIHIPKCAGNSIFHGMRDALGPSKSLVLDSISAYLAARKLKRCSNEFEFESLQLELKQVLLSFYFEQDYSIITGHLPFSPLCHAQFADTTDFITVLRHPVERLKSHVAYLIFAQPRTCVEDYHNGTVDPGDEVGRILQKDNIGIWLARSQSLYLGGLGEDGKADLENRVANAIAALDKLRIVGLDHDLPAFSRRFEEAYGVPMDIGRENTIRDVQQNAELLKRVYDVFDGSMKQVLIEMSADDAELYEAALEKWA
jgi:hypothetical protein